MTVRFGIMGCAQIAKKNSQAILRAQNAELVAVASRNADKCKQFCTEMRLPTSVRQHSSYEGMLAAPDIDVVYLPLPSKLHAQWVPHIARGKKHILIEKPVGVNADEVRTMVKVCREAGVQMMDGTMFIHHDRFARMSELFKDIYRWRPQRVTSAFSFSTDDEFFRTNVRTNPSLDPLGCLGDLGWYCVRLALAAFRYEPPTEVKATMNLENNAGVPLDMDVEMIWPALETKSLQRKCTFHCSFLAPWRQWFEAVSQEGHVIRCDDFVIPKREEVCTYNVEYGGGTTDLDRSVASARITVPIYNCAQEIKMIEKIASIVLDKKRDPWYEELMMLNHVVLDAALESARQGGTAVRVAAIDV